MRTLILALTAAAFAAALPAHAQQAPTRIRDCLWNIESGVPMPASGQSNAKWLFITNLMRSKNETGEYGSNVGWKVAESLKRACDAAVADFPKEPANKGWTLTGAVVMLVPDSVVRQATH